MTNGKATRHHQPTGDQSARGGRRVTNFATWRFSRVWRSEYAGPSRRHRGVARSSKPGRQAVSPRATWAFRFVVLISGQISSFRTTPDGTVTVVDVTQPSGHAGLQAILAQLPALVGVQTVAPSRMILIDGAGLRAMLHEEPTLASALLVAEALDFRALVLQVCDLKLRTTAQRLGHYLLELAPDGTSRSATLRLPFDKRLLAARLGCRQENLSRAFATLRELGVETRGARVVLHDIPKLRDYAVAFDET